MSNVRLLWRERDSFEFCLDELYAVGAIWIGLYALHNNSSSRSLMITADQGEAIAACYLSLISSNTLNPEPAASAEQIVIMHDVLDLIEEQHQRNKRTP